MKIAINCRLLLPHRLEGIGHFTQEIVSRWIDKYQEHEFLLLFDRETEIDFSTHKNVKVKKVYPQARHPWLYKIWLDWSLPKALKGEGVDVFFSPEEFCSLNIDIPTLICIHDLAYLNYPSSMKRREVKYRKKYVPLFLEQASAVATVSAFSKKNILKHFPWFEKDLRIIHNGCRDIFQPAENSNRDEPPIKTPYFFYYGSLNPRKNIVNLLHAYNQFRQENPSSDHKLVLGGKKGWKTRQMRTVYERHPFKKDIQFTGYLNDKEILRWLRGTEALVYVSKFEGFGLPVLEAMQTGISVITSKATSMEEVAADAAFYANAEHPGSIANAMRKVVNNNALKEEKIELGLKRAKQFSWDRAAEEMWEYLISI